MAGLSGSFSLSLLSALAGRDDGLYISDAVRSQQTKHPNVVRMCYESRVLSRKRAFPPYTKRIVKYPFTLYSKWYKVKGYMGFLKHLPGKAGDIAGT